MRKCYEGADNEDGDDGCCGTVRLDPPVCDGYLHWGNCRICYDMLDAHNDDHDDDVNFDNCDDQDGQGEHHNCCDTLIAPAASI